MKTVNHPAETIDQVLEELRHIIGWAERNNNRLGYFPALYRKVTLLIKTGIEEDFFDDGNRMERLDVIFANRYLKAFYGYQSGKTVTLSWQLAFDAAQHWQPIVLQHLLLGMNAHILLDLGIAAAETVSSDNLPALKGDFDRINTILVSQINTVQNELSHIWPLFRPLDIVAGKADELLAKYSIHLVRDQAWQVAEEISALNLRQVSRAIRKFDRRVYRLGKLIRSPGFLLSSWLMMVRMGELRSPRRIIDILK